MVATAKVVCGSVLSAALIADSTHQVTQLYYESGDCTGTPTETDGISGEKGCFTTSQGFQSENIICDVDNAAMHVTLYKDGQCSDNQVLNAFSLASRSCHVEPTLGGSFSWACYNATFSRAATPSIFAKNAVSAAVVADGMHQVKQLYYTSGDCTGTPTETDGISGDKGCFATSQGFQSEDIICDADNAAMHVTLYKDGQCSDSQVLNAFSIASSSCHVESTLGGSFSWACSNAASSKEVECGACANSDANKCYAKFGFADSECSCANNDGAPPANCGTQWYDWNCIKNGQNAFIDSGCTKCVGNNGGPCPGDVDAKEECGACANSVSNTCYTQFGFTDAECSCANNDGAPPTHCGTAWYDWNCVKNGQNAFIDSGCTKCVGNNGGPCPTNEVIV